MRREGGGGGKVKKIRAKKKEKRKRKENALSFGESALRERRRRRRRRRRRGRKMSSSGERGGDDPHVLQSLKVDTETTASLRSRSRQFEEIHLFQFNRGRVDHVLARGRKCLVVVEEQKKTGAISRTREGRSDVSAHAERRRGRESSEWRFR